jgi:CspA family cold shock protein
MYKKASVSSALRTGPKTFSFTSAAVERAGMTTLNEGQRVSFDVVKDPKKGKTNAQNLKAG